MSSTLDHLVGNVTTKVCNGLNRIISPEKRAEIQAKLYDFATNHPKLAAFLTAQLIFTAVPIVLFLLFAITVAACSLVVSISLAILAAVTFTVFTVGFALLVLLPVVCFTTLTASFLFFWALSGYYILQWVTQTDFFNRRKQAIGDRLKGLTGHRAALSDDGTEETLDDKSNEPLLKPNVEEPKLEKIERS